MNYSNRALDDLEHDISYWCSRYWIPGYEKEDLEQECRMAIWKAYNKFNTLQGTALRSWSNMVVKNKLRHLLRHSYDHKRAISHNSQPYVEYDTDALEGNDIQIEKKSTYSLENDERYNASINDLDTLLTILMENSMTLDDYFDF